MADTRKVQLAIEADASGVRQGTQQAKDAVRDMAREVKTAATDASRSLAGMGDGADQGAAKVDRGTRGIIASIERTTAALKAGERGTAAFYEQLAGARGANLAQLQPYLDQLRQAEALHKKATGTLDSMGVSAAQTKNALRQLPAQFTDIFTSLSSGQQPLTVLIQQGGQIKDSFGGIGNAVRGVVSAINPFAVAVGLAGGALVGLALAYKAGAAEADEYRKALILTGNAAGTSTGQMAAMAKAIAGTVGTQAQAADVLAQLAATGELSAGSFSKMAEAAIRLERVGGPAVKETVKAFADLAKDPLQASIKLNESTNFLTLSLYKQIKALDEQGKKTQAAKLAQDAFAAVSIERTTELEKSAGALERAWLGVKDAIGGAKDALLALGRAATNDQVLAGIEKQLEANARRTDRADSRDPASGRLREGADSQRTRLLEQKEALRETIALTAKLTNLEATRAAGVKGQVAADKGAADAAREAAAEEKKRAAIIAELSGVQADYGEQLGRLQAMRKAGTLTEERYVALVTALIAKQPYAVQLTKQQTDADERRSKALKEQLDAENKRAEALDKQRQGFEQHLQQLDDEYIELTRGKDAREAVVQKRLDDAAAMAYQVANEAILEQGYTAETVKLWALADAQQAVADARRRNTGQAQINDVVADAKRATDAWVDDMRSGLTSAFKQAFSQGGNFGKNFARALADELKTRMIAAIADALAVQVLGGLGVSVASGGAAGGSGFGGVVQGAGTLNNLYNLYSGGGGGLGGAMAAANYANVYSGSAYGTAYGSQQSAMLAAQESGMVNASTASWGAYAGYAALIYAAAMYGSSLYDKGWTGSNQIGDKAWYQISPENMKTSVLKGLGLSDKWSEILGGSVRLNHMFGYSAPQITDSGIKGTISAGDFTGSAFADVKSKPGFVRRLFGADDKTWTELKALPDDLARFFDDAAKSVLEQAKNYGAALGLPADALAGISTDIKLSLTDDAEKNKTEIAKAMGAYGDALLDAWKSALAPVAAYGESAADTIARVATAIMGVNDVLKALGMSALEASVAGGQAALELQKMFGGQQGLASAASGFLGNFYSEEERKAIARDNIASTLGGVGLSMPTTRAEFRAMVDDLVKGGALMTDEGRKQVATLLAVQEAFAGITEAGRSAADILTERQGLQDQLDQMLGNTAALLARERAKLDPSNVDLFDAIQAAKAQQEADQLAADAAKAQQQAAEESARAWQEAAAAAQRAAEESRKMWGEAAKALREEIDRLRGVNRDPLSNLGGAAREFAILTAQARAGSLDAFQRLPGASSAWEKAAEAAATSADELRIIRNRIAASLAQTDAIVATKVVPGFASGGYHVGGARIVGERGPELEVTGPSRIVPFDQLLQAGAAGGAQVAELQAVRTELERLRAFTEAALPAIARNTGAAASVLDDAARGKRGLTTTASA